MPSASSSSNSSLCAACSSNLTLLRSIATTWRWSVLPFPGITSSLTVVSRGPRMRSTTSSKRQPTTSSMGPSVPWPTPIMRSDGDNSPCLSAGPAGTNRTTLVYSSSTCSTAPIPSKERLILISKFSARRGEKYEVWGSYNSVSAFA